MWEAISNILTSANGFKTEIIILITVLIIFLAAKFNIISFSGKWLKVGAIKDNERTVIREQLNYVDSIIDKEAQTLPIDDLDHYRVKYVLSKVKDFFEQIIIFNHITNNKLYIESKQLQLHSLIYNITDNSYFKSKEMEEHIYKLTEGIINKLIQIRETYN